MIKNTLLLGRCDREFIRWILIASGHIFDPITNMILKWTISETITSIFILLVVVNPENAGACVDANNNCPGWASSGHCTTNHLYMLHKCPKSCQVCSAVAECVNKYNDQYCQLHIGNCWRPSTAANLVKNCRKTCVCKCCPATPATLPTTATLLNTTTTISVSTMRQTTATTTEEGRTTTLTSPITDTPSAPPSTPATLPTTATLLTTTVINVRTTRQTTAKTTEERRTTTLTSPITDSPSGTKATNSIVLTTTRSINATRQDLDARDISGLNTLLVSAIIAGVVAFIGVLGFLFWFWRKKGSSSGSINKPKSPSPPSVEDDCQPPEEIIWLERQPRKTSRNPMVSTVDAAATSGCSNQVFTKGSPETPVADTISRSYDTHLYHVLEEPDRTGTSRDQALSVHYEKSSVRFRLDSDYDEPVLRGALAAIGSARENEAVYEAISEDRDAKAASNSNTLDNSDEYCYSYTTAEQSLPLKQDKNRPQEAPKSEVPFYHPLEGANAGYQALEGAPANGYTPMAGKTEQSGYQPLQKSTRSFYQPLKKTNEPPRRAFTRK